MSGEAVDPPLVLANLRGPQTLDLDGVDRMWHPPAIDPHPPVGERYRRQFHPQTFKLGYKGFDIEIQHCKSTHPTAPLLFPYSIPTLPVR